MRTGKAKTDQAKVLLPKRHEFLLLGLVAALVMPARPIHTADLAALPIAEGYAGLPFGFEANRGQVDPQVKFISRQRGYDLFLISSSEAVLVLSKPPQRGSNDLKAHDWMNKSGAPHDPDTRVLRLKLLGGNANPVVVGEEELPGKVNYLMGNDPQRWRTGIPTFGKVAFLGVSPGIDLAYYGRQGQLECDFIVAPGADPRTIALNFEGADHLEVAADGSLVLSIGSQQVRFDKPTVYQQLAGVKKQIHAGYVLKAGRAIGFEVGLYDAAKPLVIDPVLNFSTYLGGSLGDQGIGIAVDPEGNVYVTGTTSSTNFAPVNSLPSSLGGGVDVFVTKLDATGSVIYSSFLGGAGTDLSGGIKVDALGHAYVVGSTDSTNFPVSIGAFDTRAHGLYDVFVAKLSPDGSALIYSTLLGGSGGDSGQALAVDADGSVYVTGGTASNREPFPTTVGAFSTTRHFSNDVYVAKLTPDGSGLAYSTLLGGDGRDIAYGIALDATGAAYVTGVTSSTNFPATIGAFETRLPGKANAFVAKFNPAGSALTYATVLGGSSSDPFSDGDVGLAITVDASGAAYVTGRTTATNFPTTLGAFDSNHSPGAFVTKLNPSGSALDYSTRLGGSGVDRSWAIAVDPDGAAYVTGETTSRDFPTTLGAFDSAGNSASWLHSDAFVTKLKPDGSGLIYSTYLGGSSSDFGRGIAVDIAGKVYVTGWTYSTDFPTSRGAVSIRYHGTGDYSTDHTDAFVTKLEPLPAPTLVSGPTAVPLSALVNQPVTFSLTATNPAGGPVSYNWDFGDGASASGNPVTHSYATLGSFLAVVTVSNGTGSREGTVAVLVRPPNTASGSLKFSESYVVRHRTYCSGNDPIFSPCFPLKLTSGGFAIRGTVSLESLDITQFNQSTSLRFQVGGFEFAGLLGDDPNYRPGATQAKFVMTRSLGSISSPVAVPFLTVKLTWSRASLGVRVVAKTVSHWRGGEYTGANPIVADEWAGLPSGLDQQMLAGALEFAGARVTFDVTNTVHISTGQKIFDTLSGELFRQSAVRAGGQASGSAGH